MAVVRSHHCHCSKALIPTFLGEKHARHAHALLAMAGTQPVLPCSSFPCSDVHAHTIQQHRGYAGHTPACIEERPGGSIPACELQCTVCTRNYTNNRESNQQGNTKKQTAAMHRACPSPKRFQQLVSTMGSALHMHRYLGSAL
eukprot:1160744-Pelagomonas_calceolata.AAC.14